jgi:hypothetical protein
VRTLQLPAGAAGAARRGWTFVPRRRREVPSLQGVLCLPESVRADATLAPSLQMSDDESSEYSDDDENVMAEDEEPEEEELTAPEWKDLGAIPCARPAAACCPSLTYRPVAHAGNNHYKKGEYRKAIELYTKAIR